MKKVIEGMLQSKGVTTKKKLEKEVISWMKGSLRRLQKENKILIRKNKIVWIYNPSKKLAKAIKEGIEI